MIARIYKPTKNAMQSGPALHAKWILAFETNTAPTIEPLMGWTSGTDTRRQVRMKFDTCEEAIAYAQRHGLAYRILEHKLAKQPQIAYSDNFKADRSAPWTH